MKPFLKKLGPVCAVVGGQWGDEGKGKLVDILSEHYAVVVRATGGANAGHTIYVGGKKFVFHLVPAGMLHPKTTCVMGNGMVVHLPTLVEEMGVLRDAGVDIKDRLKLSDRAHLVFDYHKTIDQLQESLKGNAKVGTTGRGIGPAYTHKISRIGIRTGELLDFKSFEARYRQNLAYVSKLYGISHDAEAELKNIKKLLPLITPLIVDSGVFLEEQMRRKKKILLEGANGTLLDIDHGTFPFVTSSNASIGGIITGTGISPFALSSAIGIMKAYTTRVGSGPFPTELNDAIGEKLRTIGNEFGATTGRPRRCGWFDAVAARYAVRINGFTAINLTKVDVLNDFDALKIGVAYKYKGKRITDFPANTELLEKCAVEYVEIPGWKKSLAGITTYEKLPKQCRAYISFIEKNIGCPVSFIGTGLQREEMIVS